jgi:hypothetical protein
MKKLALILAVISLMACKKDNEVVPDTITFTVTTGIKLEGKVVDGVDSTQVIFKEVNDPNSVVIAYTNAQGSATVSLKKDTEYTYSANSRTYNGPHYYYKQPVWLRSSWTTDKGETYYQKGWNTTFYKEDRIEGYGSTSTTKAL